MKALIEIGGQSFMVEVDRTIPKDVIRVGSIDRFLTAMAAVEKASENAAPAPPMTPSPLPWGNTTLNTSLGHPVPSAVVQPNGDQHARRYRSHVRLGGRGEVREQMLAILRSSEAQKLAEDDRRLLELRFGLNGIPMTLDELSVHLNQTRTVIGGRLNGLLKLFGIATIRRGIIDNNTQTGDNQ
jgi:hypothetical protein